MKLLDKPRPFEYISISQFNTYRRCPKIWWFRQCYPLRPSKKGRKGIDFHALVADFMRGKDIGEGQPQDLIRKAAAQGLLPRRSDVVAVEHEFRGQFNSGLEYRGKIDLLYKTQAGGLVVLDHKLSTAHPFRNHSQFTFYCWHLARTRTDFNSLWTTELVYDLDAVAVRRSFAVEYRPTQGARLAAEMEAAAQRMSAMSEWRKGDVIGCRSACEQLHGCQFKGVCDTFKGKREV